MGASPQPSGPNTGSVAVIGAGIVGLACALNLQRAGCTVTIFDPNPPGRGASFGNTGLINADAHMPVAIPGMLRNVPRWLADPMGPVTVRPRYALKAAPWLFRWLLASRASEARRNGRALRALHTHNHEEYRRLLGPRYGDLIRSLGSVLLLDDLPGAAERFGAALRDELGVQADLIGSDDLRQLYPDMAPVIRRALFFPRNGNTVSPTRLTATLAELFVEAGGRFDRRHVARVQPANDGIELFPAGSSVRTAIAVVAAGAHSRTLLDPLGVRIPLETERGYHLHLSGPNVTLRVPLIYKARGMAMTSMEDGLRLAGTVEIGGLDAAPDLRRAHALLGHARILFPHLAAGSESPWMGFRPSLPDSVAAIGPAPRIPRLFVATGHGHDGMIGAPATGRLIAELVTGAPPHIDPAPYSLQRFRGAR
jgi:D-amino-acid dehydrogenase